MEQEIVTNKEKIDFNNPKQRKAFLLLLPLLFLTLASGLYLVGKRVTFRKKATGAYSCQVEFHNDLNTALLGEGRICRVDQGAHEFDIKADASSEKNKFRLNWRCENGVTNFIRVLNGTTNISDKCYLNDSADACPGDGCHPLSTAANSGYVICKGFSQGAYNIKLEFSSTTSGSGATATPNPAATTTPTTIPTGSTTPIPTAAASKTPTPDLNATATPTPYCLCSNILETGFGDSHVGCYTNSSGLEVCARNIQVTPNDPNCARVNPSLPHYRCYNYETCDRSETCLYITDNLDCYCARY